MTKSADFFAKVFRPPLLRPIGGASFEVMLINPAQSLGEAGMVISLSLPLLFIAWFFIESPLVILPVLALVFGYAMLFASMRNSLRNKRAEIRDREIRLQHRAMRNFGKVLEVLCVDLSGHEDPEDSENGSTRLYLRVDSGDHRSAVLPFLISAATLRTTANSIAQAADCPCQYLKGASALPPESEIISLAQPA